MKVSRATAVYLYIVSFVLILYLNGPALGQEVEVEVGPEFQGEDSQSITDCIKSALEVRFPFSVVNYFAEDPLAELEQGGNNSCPTLTLFGYDHEFCWAIDIFLIIEPAVVIGLLMTAIINL